MSAAPLKVTILGCGSSTGTPSIEGGWGACDPEEPRNRRTRPSILIDWRDTRILVDTAPDLRQQFLREEIHHLDAVIVTHAHADHLHGIDDLRGVNRRMNAPIPLWCDQATLDTIEERFGYVLTPLPEEATVFYKPVLLPHLFYDCEPFRIGPVEIVPCKQDHGYSNTHGLRLGKFAYCTDLVGMPDESLAMLEGVETLLVGAFHWKPHPTHLHVDGALELIEKVGATRAVITHMSPNIDYRELTDYLPQGVAAAYDGMVIQQD